MKIKNSNSFNSEARQRAPGWKWQTPNGFTLIEVLFTLGLLSVALLGLAIGANTVIQANQKSFFHTAATNLAQDKLEDLKGKTAGTITSCASSCDNPVPTHQNVPFTRTWTVTANQPMTGVSTVTVTVQWTDYQSQSVSLSSVVDQ